MIARKLIFILFIAVQATIISAQNRVVLHKGVKRIALKRGQLVGITLKGENYRFSGYSDACACASPSQGLFWTVDSITKGHMALSLYKYQFTYRYDTLALNHKPKGRHYVRVERVFSKGDDRSKDRIVYKTVLSERFAYRHRTLSYDSIGSFTLSHANIKKCGLDHDKANFTYYQPDSKYVKAPAAIAIMLLTFTEGLVEYSINTTAAATETINRKKRQLHRYDLSDWHMKIK